MSESSVVGELRTLDRVRAKTCELRTGDRVRLRPRDRADLLDLALVNQIAIIESIELDGEGRAHLGVVIDDNPRMEMDFLREPGYKFFYGVDEVEPVVTRRRR